MKAIIVDDEILARKRIGTLLKKIKEIEIIQECATGKSAIVEINKLKPDLIFLDINLKDLNGFQVLQSVEVHPKPFVVFVTAHVSHAAKAFDFEALDFLLKPFKEERFYKTIQKVLQTPRGETEKIYERHLETLSKIKKNVSSKLPIRQGNKTALLSTSKIKYILASGYYAEIYTKERKYVIRESLSNLDEMLDPGKFFRVHRSAIVNLSYIQEIVHSNFSEIDARMKDERLISVSKSMKKEFFKRLGI